jgi:hypothetical protein
MRISIIPYSIFVHISLDKCGNKIKINPSTHFLISFSLFYLGVPQRTPFGTLKRGRGDI